MATTIAQDRVRRILINGAAEARGLDIYAHDRRCSACNCLCPAAELAECGRADCPLEGREEDRS